MSFKDDRSRKRAFLLEPDSSKRSQDEIGELELSFDEEVFDRVTQRPEAGPEKFALVQIYAGPEFHIP